MDVHVRRPVATALRRRGVDVLTAQEDGSDHFEDPELLDRALDLSRVLFTQDDDLLVEAARRQRIGKQFFGLIYGHQRNITARQTIDDLELLAKACAEDELVTAWSSFP